MHMQGVSAVPSVGATVPPYQLRADTLEVLEPRKPRAL
jgi:hypothetical protein